MRVLNTRVFSVMLLLMICIGVSLHSQTDTISVLPWVEHFTNWLPNGWQVSGTWLWAHNNTAECAYADFWGQSGGSSELVSPAVQLHYNTNLTFKWSHQYMSGYQNDRLDVLVSRDSLNWEQVWSLDGSELNSNDGASANNPGTFVEEAVSLNAYTGNTVWIKFAATSGYGPCLFLDDVGICSSDLFEHDLAAVTVSGQLDTMVNLYSRFNVTVMNNGYQIENNYNVNLYVDSTLIYGINGQNIAYGETKDFQFIWVPDSSYIGDHVIWAEIALDTDMDNLNNATANVDLHIQEEMAGIYGHVFSDSGNPMENVKVTIVEADVSRFTDENGFYYIPDMNVGYYTVRVSKYMYNTKQSNVYFSSEFSLKEKNYFLSDGSLIAGTVSGNYDFPIEGVEVNNGTEITVTDSGGRYTMSNLATGDYTLTFRKNGYVDSVVSNVTVIEGENTVSECRLLKYGKLKLMINTDSGRIIDTYVRLSGADSSYVFSVSDSVFVIDSLSHDIYSLHIEADGYNDYFVDCLEICYYDYITREISLDEIRKPVSNLKFNPVSGILSWMHPDFDTRYLIGFKVDVNNGESVVYPDSTSTILSENLSKQSVCYVKVYAVYTSGLSDSVQTSFRITSTDSDVESYVTKILGNYPNPFNPETIIRFSLSRKQNTELSIYNIKGQKVCTLAKEKMNKGLHDIKWSGRNSDGKMSAAGTYLYRLITEENTQTGKMILLK